MRVPFVSQQSYRDPQWRRFGCGIASLKMVLDYWHTQDPRNRTDGADDLYAAGLAAGAFDPAVGWRHAGLVGLATALEYQAYNRDFAAQGPTPLGAEDAFAELAAEVRDGPVIVSAYRGFDPGRGGGHLVVVTGIARDAVELNDPEPAHENDGRRVLPVRDFLPAFKHRYVVVRP